MAKEAEDKPGVKKNLSEPGDEATVTAAETVRESRKIRGASWVSHQIKEPLDAVRQRMWATELERSDGYLPRESI